MEKKFAIRAMSRGHHVQAKNGVVFLSIDTDQGVIQIGMDNAEASLFVSTILNEGTAAGTTRSTYVEVSADPVEVTGASLSIEDGGYRTLVLICGEVRIPVRLSSELVSEICSGHGDEIHRVN